MIDVFYFRDAPYYVIEFVENAIDYLSLRECDADLHIIRSDDLSEGEYGYCSGSPDSVEVVYSRFLPSKIDVLLTIAHEMIHVKQIVRGELINEAKAPPGERWKGRPQKIDPSSILRDDLDKMSDEEYHNLPWEKEAYGRQDEVYSACSRSTPTYRR